MWKKDEETKTEAKSKSIKEEVVELAKEIKNGDYTSLIHSYE